ncbi:hypothetical protein VU07_05435 [Desulfobulbus sp. F4]|nr:hypothetical protein [Desulfobulbus sp. F4]
MKKLVIAACAAAIFFAVALSVQAEEKKNCVRGYGKTVDEAFALGVKLAESKDAELDKENQLIADTRIRILPEKVNGLYVVEVYSSRKGACDLKPKHIVADSVEP